MCIRDRNEACVKLAAMIQLLQQVGPGHPFARHGRHGEFGGKQGERRHGAIIPALWGGRKTALWMVSVGADTSCSVTLAVGAAMKELPPKEG